MSRKVEIPPEHRQYRFDTDPQTNSFVKKLPSVLEQRRLNRQMARDLAKIEDEWMRGENCPDKSIVDTRRGIDLNYDIPFAVVITQEKENEPERAYRYVGEVTPRKNGMVAKDDVEPWALALVEDQSKLVAMPGIVINAEKTFGLDWDVSRAIQQGGVVFKTRKELKGNYGIWEELEGNGEGAFRMSRKLPSRDGVTLM